MKVLWSKSENSEYSEYKKRNTDKLVITGIDIQCLFRMHN